MRGTEAQEAAGTATIAASSFKETTAAKIHLTAKVATAEKEKLGMKGMSRYERETTSR